MTRLGRTCTGAILACVMMVPACREFGAGFRKDDAKDTRLLALIPDQPELIGAAQAAIAPHVYLDIQDDGGASTSAVFVIDRSRDGTPADDPAIRLTPENGECNPQILRAYRFPSDIPPPVYSQNIALIEGITLAELPNLMAIETTSEMMRRGVIADPNDGRPQNICARKLWTILLATEDFGRTLVPHSE